MRLEVRRDLRFGPVVQRPNIRTAAVLGARCQQKLHILCGLHRPSVDVGRRHESDTAAMMASADLWEQRRLWGQRDANQLAGILTFEGQLKRAARRDFRTWPRRLAGEP